MSRLHPDKQYPVSKETLMPICAKYGIADFSWEPVHDGIANTSVFVEYGEARFVLRIYRQGRKDDKTIELELDFQDYLREHGIPIPVIYKNSEGKELTHHETGGVRWQCILMEYKDGTTHAAYTPELVQELSAIQVKMHRLGTEFACERQTGPLWKDLSLKTVPEESDFKTAELNAFIRRIRGYSYPLISELPYGYNHLDLDLFGNITVKDNRINGLFDFDDLEYSPLVACLGNTLWDVLFEHSEARMRDYLAAYEKGRTLTQNEKIVLPHVVFFRNYMVASAVILTGKHTGEIPKLIEYEKIIPKVFANLTQ